MRVDPRQATAQALEARQLRRGSAPRDEPHHARTMRTERRERLEHRVVVALLSGERLGDHVVARESRPPARRPTSRARCARRGSPSTGRRPGSDSSFSDASAGSTSRRRSSAAPRRAPSRSVRLRREPMPIACSFHGGTSSTARAVGGARSVVPLHRLAGRPEEPPNRRRCASKVVTSCSMTVHANASKTVGVRSIRQSKRVASSRHQRMSVRHREELASGRRRRRTIPRARVHRPRRGRPPADRGARAGCGSRRIPSRHGRMPRRCRPHLRAARGPAAFGAGARRSGRHAAERAGRHDAQPAASSDRTVGAGRNVRATPKGASRAGRGRSGHRGGRCSRPRRGRTRGRPRRSAARAIARAARKRWHPQGPSRHTGACFPNGRRRVEAQEASLEGGRRSARPPGERRSARPRARGLTAERIRDEALQADRRRRPRVLQHATPRRRARLRGDGDLLVLPEQGRAPRRRRRGAHRRASPSSPRSPATGSTRSASSRTRTDVSRTSIRTRFRSSRCVASPPRGRGASSKGSSSSRGVAGLDDRTTARFYRVVSSYCSGVALNELAGLRRGSARGSSPDDADAGRRGAPRPSLASPRSRRGSSRRTSTTSSSSASRCSSMRSSARRTTLGRPRPRARRIARRPSERRAAARHEEKRLARSHFTV